MAKRIPIPKRTENLVMDRSEGKCYCGKRGHQIHHIDGNNSNNDFDNLAFVCIDHHDDATIVLDKSKRIIKRLTPIQLKAARDKQYREIEKRKEVALKHYKATLKHISDENLYRASLDANIIIEIIKIRERCSEVHDWEKQEEELRKIRMFSEHSSLRVAREVIDFMNHLAGLTRGNMPSDFSDLIESITLDYFPYPENAKEKKVVEELAEDCANIATNIIYDAFIYLGNFAVASSGFLILKYLQLKSKSYKSPKIAQIVLNHYKELEQHLDRPERPDLEKAKSILKIFKDDLNKHGLAYPAAMPSEMFHTITEHRKKARQRTH
ncbi:MAG: HNH endonuclease signature motif containing protein [Bacteroidia bacterium]